MKRTLFVALVASLTAAAVPAAAQQGTQPVSEPRFTPTAVRRAVLAVSTDASLPARAPRLPSGASGADTNRSWDTLVTTVTIGEKLTITLADMTSADGKLLGIDPRSIRIEAPEGPRAIAAGDVVRVRHAGVRKRRVLHGILIGMVAGGLASFAIDQHSSHPYAAEAAGMGAIFIGLPGGAIVGAALPIGPPLYEAANANPKP
jgi:hypothetical protein